MPVEVEQFVGAWYPLDAGSISALWIEADSFSEQLGVGAVVGDEIWDQQSGVRITLGPLTLRAVSWIFCRTARRTRRCGP